jgi:hypothetical protein
LVISSTAMMALILGLGTPWRRPEARQAPAGGQQAAKVAGGRVSSRERDLALFGIVQNLIHSHG